MSALRCVRPLAVVAGAIAAMTLAGGVAFAQIQTGEIAGQVTDKSSAVMPGVTVTIESSALIQPQTRLTGPSGGYQFPRIPIGTYTVRFELPGFKTLIRQGIRVEAGFSAEIDAGLELATVEETVTVSGESPVVDTRAVKTGQTFTQEMLDHIPSARDPWVILEQTPGVVMSRQNVGGSESGQQSSFTVHGGNSGNTMWNVDGVTITDMAATGASPTYYDFDSFEEIQIQTGGNDASLQTGGINLNMITKSGSNVIRGSARTFLVDNAMQSNNVTRELFDAGAEGGNPIKNIKDYGFEVGGPIVRNKAWFWGGYGRQDIRVGVLGFYKPIEACGNATSFGYDQFDQILNCLETDLTKLENYNAKLQFQPWSSQKFTMLYTRGDKIRNARGASRTRPPETTFRQTGPTDLYKAAHQWILGDRTTIETQAAYTAGGFVLDFHRPELESVQPLYDFDTDTYSRSYVRSGPFDRPQTEIKSDMHYFAPAWIGADHSMKWGIRWRDTPSFSGYKVGGDAFAWVRNGEAYRVYLYRQAAQKKGMTNLSLYVNDSISRGRFTVNLGVRYDQQDDRAEPSIVPANSIRPDILPSVDFQGADSGVVYRDVSPRAGVTFDLFGTGRTVLKASGAVYYGQGIFTSEYLNPTSAAWTYHQWKDLNGDLFVQTNEVGRMIDWDSNDYDPSNPSATTTPVTVDDSLDNDRTRELIAGFDHELMSNFAVGASYIWRKYDRFLTAVPVGVQVSDYVPVEYTVACGNASCDQDSYTITYYRLPFRRPSREVLTNDPYYRDFNGLELTARKRYSGRWMMNASLALGSTVGRFPDWATWAGDFDPTSREFVDGAQENTRNARWIFKTSGMYTFPLDINGSFFLNARQGFPFFRSIRSPSRGNGLSRVNAKFEPDGTSRHESLVTLDARVEKWFQVRNLRMAWSVDVFNVGNSNTVLSREGRQNLRTANRVNEILAPRVVRVGFRVKF